MTFLSLARPGVGREPLPELFRRHNVLRDFAAGDGERFVGSELLRLLLFECREGGRLAGRCLSRRVTGLPSSPEGRRRTRALRRRARQRQKAAGATSGDGELPTTDDSDDESREHGRQRPAPARAPPRAVPVD